MSQSQVTSPPAGNPRSGRRQSALMLPALALLLLAGAAMTGCSDKAAGKSESVFFPADARLKLRTADTAGVWGESARREAVEAAAPWLAMADDALWELMFGPTITRSWMVWSNGHCPSCRKPVPMYSWKVDALRVPWKMECPHCASRFPKNDFQAFYRSGLDARGVFDPALADRNLLFNAEHPGQDDPLRTFGVDDGGGYFEGPNRWLFVGTYLIYGQWKQAVHKGIVRLSQAYFMTGEPGYAHKALVLLDRVADLYPGFDFKTQAVMYEGPASDGYVSTWHDACEETRELALAYDLVRGAVAGDAGLRDFLSGRAAKYGLENRKRTADDIRRNIEDRILRDAVAHSAKIRSNYPRTETALVIIHSVLDWPANRTEVKAMIDELVSKATAVDGVTGEKGLAAYAASTIANLAYVLALFDRIDEGFIEDVLARHPALRNSYRFHYDTWFGGHNYPEIGDTGNFGRRQDRYAGANFLRDPFLPSMFTFFWKLYELTGDPAYVKILYHENGGKADGLPFDLLGPDPAEFQGRVASVIAEHGADIRGPSFNKERWHLALLRSGRGADERAVWIDYDTGGRHGHADAMNVGLFAKGLDLMPDLGYPPVQYGGGWSGPKAVWYRKTAAHNTVTVDGRDQKMTSREIAGGRTTLWGPGEAIQAVRVAAPEAGGADRFERTIALVDVSASDSYVLDIFRVAGGRDHARFMRGHFGSLAVSGLSLGPLPDYGFETQMRGFRGDPRPRPGWSADWTIEDRYGYRPGGSGLHLRLTDLTSGALAATAETWISASRGYDEVGETWIPTVMVRRPAGMGTGAEPLVSTFVGIVEPYEGRPLIKSVRRLPVRDGGGALLPDGCVALEVALADGRRDLLLSADAAPAGAPALSGSRIMVLEELGLRTDAELLLVRTDRDGRLEHLALSRGTLLETGDTRIKTEGPTSFLEISFDGKIDERPSP